MWSKGAIKMYNQKIFNLLVVIIVFFSLEVDSFPGDHNSLTCDKNFIGLTATIDDKPNTIITDDTFNTDGTRAKEGILSKYFRTSETDLNAAGKINRKNIVDAIKADLALPHSQSKVKQNIRANLDDTYEGKPLQVTKWGDSLSDFVSFYGVLTPGAIGDGIALPPVGGIYGGSPIWIDSWSDYFTMAGQPNLTPVYVRNYGIATYQTKEVMSLMGFSSYYDSKNG